MKPPKQKKLEQAFIDLEKVFADAPTDPIELVAFRMHAAQKVRDYWKALKDGRVPKPP